jgi:peptidoglycan hydrolase CwlO-like protein
LRIVWFTCKELYKFIEDVNYDEAELSELRENKFKIMDKVRNIRKTIREINTSINATRNLIQVMDDELKGILLPFEHII